MIHDPLQAPLSRAEIADQIEWLSEHMIDIGTSMQYYGGFNKRWNINGGNLIGAGEISAEWAKTIRKDLKRESKRIRKAAKA